MKKFIVFALVALVMIGNVFATDPSVDITTHISGISGFKIVAPNTETPGTIGLCVSTANDVSNVVIGDNSGKLLNVENGAVFEIKKVIFYTNDTKKTCVLSVTGTLFVLNGEPKGENNFFGYTLKKDDTTLFTITNTDSSAVNIFNYEYKTGNNIRHIESVVLKCIPDVTAAENVKEGDYTATLTFTFTTS